MKLKDYYATLGVPPDDTPDDIKKPCPNLAREYHPEVGREPLAELRFKEVGEAYAVLKDPEKRLAYDQIPRPLFSRRESTSSSSASASRRPPQWCRSYSSAAKEKEAAASTANQARRAERTERPHENFGNILDEMMGR